MLCVTATKLKDNMAAWINKVIARSAKHGPSALFLFCEGAPCGIPALDGEQRAPEVNAKVLEAGIRCAMMLSQEILAA